MKKSTYWSWCILGVLLFALGMSEVATQAIGHHGYLGSWAYSVGTWGVIMVATAFL